MQDAFSMSGFSRGNERGETREEFRAFHRLSPSTDSIDDYRKRAGRV